MKTRTMTFRVDDVTVNSDGIVIHEYNGGAAPDRKAVVKLGVSDAGYLGGKIQKFLGRKLDDVNSAIAEASRRPA